MSEAGKQVFATDIGPDDDVEELFRVVQMRLLPYRDEHKGDYLLLILADQTGQIEARIWENASEPAQWLSANDIVHVRGRAELYQERIRLRVDEIIPAKEGTFAIAEFLPPVGIDDQQALADIHGTIDRISNQPLRLLLQTIFGDTEFVSNFCLAPREKPGGLLEQTMALLELAAPLERVNPKLDLDLLTAGILLHEAGTSYAIGSETGREALDLLGIAAVSDQLLCQNLTHLPEFPNGLALKLRHIILAAASPSIARSPEALVLARLKQLQESARNI
ncbi:MAG: OB-fold nucleic acid binding domain-containing protein [Chloroflexota bacterium]|nr:OB-fold nucleic acid binding domain-containing protein [Chloroflexota bacterium]